MAVKKQARIPNVFRNPLLAEQVTEWMQDRLDEWKKAEHDAGRGQRAEKKVRLITAAIAEVDRIAAAKIGDQLDGL